MPKKTTAASEKLIPLELHKRIDKACERLAQIAMWRDHWNWDHRSVDEAVRLLQGRNYKKFVARIEKEYDNPLHSWHTGREK